MKTILRHIVIGMAAALAAETQAVITLSLEPALQLTGVGGTASVDLRVTGLGNLAAPSLGGFDIDLTYNSAVLSASSLSFGSLLDLGTLGSAQFADLSVPGQIHLDEVSFEVPADLNNAQPDAFTLATLDFLGLAPGLSVLNFGLTSLSDENGVSIQGYALTTATIEVVGNAVPEAGSTATLLLAGVTALWTWRYRSNGRGAIAS